MGRRESSHLKDGKLRASAAEAGRGFQAEATYPDFLKVPKLQFVYIVDKKKKQRVTH
jgi:hypothetical protein